MIKKIHVLIALYSLISHSVESVAAEPEGVKPRRVLTLKEQIPTWHHYSDLPTVCGQKVVDFLNFSDKTNLQTIDQINSYIIENKYKDKDSPFLKIQSALLFFFDGIRENNSAAFKMYVSPKLSSSDSFFCLQHLCAQGLVSKKIVDDAEKKWHLSRKKSLAPYNQERVFEKTLGFLWEGWQYYLFDVCGYFKRYLDAGRLNIDINEIYADVDLAEFRQELKGLAELGWTEAQGYVAAWVAQGTYGFKKDPIELKRLAELGWTEAQEYVVAGLAEGTYGFKKDPAKIAGLVKLGWTDAQKYVVEGLADGDYSFTHNLTKLQHLTRLGWVPAQKYVVDGFAEGKFGFKKDPAKLIVLAHSGWTPAQEYVESHCYIFRDIIKPKFLKLLEQTAKWVPSRDFANLILGTIPLTIDKLAFALHMACLEQSRKG